MDRWNLKVGQKYVAELSIGGCTSRSAKLVNIPEGAELQYIGPAVDSLNERFAFKVTMFDALKWRYVTRTLSLTKYGVDYIHPTSA